VSGGKGRDDGQVRRLAVAGADIVGMAQESSSRNELVGADVLVEEYQPPQGFFVLLTTDEVGEAQRVFQSLAEEGTVLMAAQKTFWSPCFGVLVDRFGIPWEVSCEQKPARPE